MKGSKGKMQGTRRKLRRKGDFSPNDFLKEFDVGEKVQIDIEPSSHKNMPGSRFQGKIVEIVGKEGTTCITKLKEGNKTKKIKVKPVHLKKIQSKN